MLSRSELKEKAKTSLNGKYGEAIKITLILFLISFVVGFVVGFTEGILEIKTDSSISKIISNVIEIVISGIFSFGYLSFFIKISRDEEVTYNELFSKTNMFITYILVTLLIGVFVTLGYICLIIPGIIISIGLSQVFYILLDNPDMNIMEAIKKSWNMMKGHKLDYVILQLSFLGWMIVGIFTLGILYLWLVPYIAVTNANFYNSLKEINE